MKQKWLVKEVSCTEMEKELNALGREEYKIYSINEMLNFNFRIIAYLEVKNG